MSDIPGLGSLAVISLIALLDEALVKRDRMKLTEYPDPRPSEIRGCDEFIDPEMVRLYSPFALEIRGRDTFVDPELALLCLAPQWIQHCQTYHSSCKQNSELSLPFRVLEIRGDVVRLREGRDLRGHYTILSHCWGHVATEVTTTNTLARHQDGIALSELPATFRDAVKVTKDLEVKYVWIDSLCII